MTLSMSGANADNTGNSTGNISLTAPMINNTGNSITASNNFDVSTTRPFDDHDGILSAKHFAGIKWQESSQD